MYTPNPQDPNFGSEVRRRETPEHRRQRRRRGFVAALFGIGLGIFTIVIGAIAIRSGELVAGGPGQVALPGEIVAPMGVCILVMSAWALWRLLTNKE
jgi:hypothetical protein